MKKFGQSINRTSPVCLSIALVFGLSISAVRSQSEEADYENVVPHITVEGEVSYSTAEPGKCNGSWVKVTQN